MHQDGDISEIKRTIEELKYSTERYSSLFHNQHITMFLVDSETNYIVDTNEAASNFYGYAKEELLKMNMSELRAGQDVEIIKCGQTQNYLQHRLAKGEVRDVEVYCTPTTIKGSRLLYVIVYDITERKNVEYALKESEEKFRKLFENANDAAIFLHGYQESGIPDKFLEVNNTACRIFGYSKDEFKKISPVEINDLENNEKFKQRSKQVLRSGSITFERNLITKMEEAFLLSSIPMSLS